MPQICPDRPQRLSTSNPSASHIFPLLFELTLFQFLSAIEALQPQNYRTEDMNRIGSLPELQRPEAFFCPLYQCVFPVLLSYICLCQHLPPRKLFYRPRSKLSRLIPSHTFYTPLVTILFYAFENLFRIS